VFSLNDSCFRINSISSYKFESELFITFIIFLTLKALFRLAWCKSLIPTKISKSLSDLKKRYNNFCYQKYFNNISQIKSDLIN
jgi:hypothetical protein